ncbi:MAG: DNA alkylation repair protein [Rubrivivax sp.]|nr:DNA alkylation repair protein [Rubrivivax sp.]
MAEPFKNLINAALVRQAAAHLRRSHPAFDGAAFTAEATRGLEALEMKQRTMHIATALEHALPADFDAAARALEAALAPAAESEDLAQMRMGDAGLAGWILWPVGEFVVRRGMAHPRRSLEVLHALTMRFSAEFAIRPFIATHPELAFATLARWARDRNPHVRRLASEGSRPRLPWGMRLNALVIDPSPALPLLRALQDDPSEYVRRSVANHLNDIAKDHPGLLADWLAQHLPGAGAERRALLRHASRTLIKQGDARVLAAWGLGGRLRGQANLTVKPARIALGEAVQLTLSLRSTARTAQVLHIDYAVHHVKANGGTSPKVFKGWHVTLAPREARTLQRQHAVRPVTTRVYHPGRHRVVVQVNGQPVAEAAFTLRV